MGCFDYLARHTGRVDVFIIRIGMLVLGGFRLLK